MIDYSHRSRLINIMLEPTLVEQTQTSGTVSTQVFFAYVVSALIFQQLTCICYIDRF